MKGLGRSLAVCRTLVESTAEMQNQSIISLIFAKYGQDLSTSSLRRQSSTDC